MKKWIILGASVLVVVCICAYLLLFVVDAGHGLSFYMEKKIEADWKEQKHGDWIWEVGPVQLAFYFGEENGYLIFFVEGPFDWQKELYFGDIMIQYNSDFYLYAYQDGVFYDLEEVYEQGLISDDMLLTIKEKLKFPLRTESFENGK